MPRLLLPTLEYPPQIGGIAEYLASLVRYFQDEIEVIQTPALLAPFGWPRWGKAVLELMKRRASYEMVVVSHVLPIGTAAWIAKFFTHRPYTVIVHGMDVGITKRTWLKRVLAGWVLRGAKLVVANSKALEAEVQKDFGVKEALVVYPCVSAPAVRLPPLVEPTLTILTVARLVSRKGHRRVLRALALMKMEGRLPESFHYRIVGDGPEYERIALEVKRLGLESIVQFHPAVPYDQLQQMYASSRVFVMPTVKDAVDREGFGIVYLEAALFGIPSVATDQPGVNEAVLDGQTGILVPDGDIPALAEAIYRLFTDETLRVRLGAAARERAEREFTPEKQFGKLKEILRPVASE